MAQVTITQLPNAQALTGSEAIPVVQNGVTVQTTTLAIAQAGGAGSGTVTQINTGTGLTGGPINTNGTISLTNTGVTAGSYTNANITVDQQGRITLASSGSVNSGTVTNVSVVSARGFTGTVSNPTTTPAITLGTSVTGLLQGNGTSIFAAVSGTDYAPATSGTSILYGNGSGGFSNVTIGSNLTFAGGTLSAIVSGSGTVTNVSVVSANGFAGSVANASTTPAITLSTPITGLLKGDGTGISAATSGTDYAPATSGSAILYGNGSGGFSNVTIGTNLTFSGGTLNATGGGSGMIYPSAGIANSTGSAWDTSYSTTGSGTVVALATSPALVTPILGTPQSGNFSTGTFTWPTFNQNTTGTAANVSGTVAIANGGTGATSASSARSNLSAAQSGTNTDITSIALTTGTISTTPSGTTDIVNKSYADSLAAGTNFHQACNYATTAALSPANTYNNGSSGVGATLTGNSNATLTIDGYTFVSGDVGKRILVKNEVAGANNGIYTLTQAGTAGLPYILTRATDFDTVGAGQNEIAQGDLTLILSGTANSNTQWVQQTPAPIIVGTTAIVFVQFGNGTTYSAGTGLTLTGSTFSVTSPFITFGATSQSLGSTVSGLTGVTVDNGAIGGTTPAAGTFTTLIGGGGSANYEQITGGATGKAVQFQSLGSDANVSLAIQPKGTGAIDLAAGSSGVNISNGGTVTALTRTANGSSYTSPPTLAISAPTTNGGVQATATTALALNAGLPTITSGGTSGTYAVNDVLTFVGGTFTQAAQLTVTSVSAGVITGISISLNGIYTVLPSNPISVTGGGGSGATFTATTGWGLSGIFTITNAGSGYVEQPTVTFSGGGGSGAAAYATVGATALVTALSNTFRFANAGGIGFQVGNAGTATVNYLSAQGSASGGSVLLGAAGSDGNIPVRISSFGTSAVSLFTNNSGQEALRATHTASAVNYVQVTGGATGSSPQISAQGSDATASLIFITKGSLDHRFATNTSATNVQFRVSHTAGTIVNYASATGNIAGASPSFSVAGSDTDIDLTLTPKGAGRVKTTTAIQSRLDPKVVSTGSASSLTPSVATAEIYAYTALAANLTINAPTGTPVDGNKLMFRLLDNGTARTLTWDATYTVMGVTLPTTTTANKTTYVGCIYNANNTRWDVIAVTTQV